MRFKFILALALTICILSAIVMAKSDGLVTTHQRLFDKQTQMMIQTLKVKLTNLYGPQKALNSKVYVGSEFCIACHQDKAGWRNTKHAQALRRPMEQYSLIPGKGVVADYDQNGVDDFQQGLDFNTIASAFDPYKPNAPKLSFENGTYYITIGELKMPVVCTQGGTGDWKQRYLVRVPVTDTPDGYSTENYVSPIQFNEKTHQYVLYHAGDWYDENNQPKFDSTTTSSFLATNNSRQYSEKCIGCHTTGIRDLKQNAAGEWNYTPYVAVLFNQDDPGYFDYDHDGNVDLVNIGCEACHGPGSAHILGGGDPTQIVNPADLDTKAANEICGQCHVRVKSVPNGTHDWPFNDETNTSWMPGSGVPLSDFYTDAAGRWPDGKTSKQHHQQYFDFYESSKPTFQFHPIKCVDCHEPHHPTSNDHLIVDQIQEDDIVIPTSNDNDTLCLACHATHGDFADITPEMVADFENNKIAIGQVVSAHTHHPFAPDRLMGLSRCSTCHMPKVAKSAIAWDIHSHTFEPIPPEKTINFQDQGGMPNACAASCHSMKVNLWGFGIDPDISVWNEDFDFLTATELMEYYGPEGSWWTTELASAH